MFFFSNQNSINNLAHKLGTVFIELFYCLLILMFNRHNPFRFLQNIGPVQPLHSQQVALQL